MREKPLILVTDDEANFREIIPAKLKAVGYDVRTAESGSVAQRLAEELLPDLILMDVNMPGQNGTETALAIKANPKTKDIKIAFLTSLKDPWPGFLADSNQAVARELGAEQYFNKDADLNDIVAKVRALLALPPVPPASA